MKNLFTALFSDVEKFRALSQSKDLIDSASSSGNRPPVLGSPRSNIMNRFSLFNINPHSIRRPPTISLGSSSRSDSNLLKGKSPMIESGLAQSIVDQSKNEDEASFKEFLKKLEKQLEPETLDMSYRYPPGGHSDFIKQTFLFTKKMRQKIIDFSSNLELTKRNFQPGPLELILFRSRIHNFRNMFDTNNGKKWVEVRTLYKGISGKFIVMAILGTGCIVWYSLLPVPMGLTSAEISPLSIRKNLCTLDDEDLRNVFNKVLFIDNKNIKGDVQSAYENLYPFSQINIPAPDSIKLALGFGVMMAIILGMGITADTSLTSILDTLNPSQVDSIQTIPSTGEDSSIQTIPCIEEDSSIQTTPSTEEESSIRTIPSTEEDSNAGGAAIENNKVIEI